jgi:uncharacterized protein (DUF362 family)
LITGGAALQRSPAAAAAQNVQTVTRAPASPVSIAKVASYDEDLVARLQTMFDQIGGITRLVRGKTVTVKLNLTGGGRYEGHTPGQTHWVHPTLVGACCAAFGKAGAKRIRLVESSARKPGVLLEDKMLDGGWDVKAIRSAAPLVEFEDTNNLGQAKKYSRLKVLTRPYIYPAFEVNHSYEDTDVYVSLSKLKNHEECGITLTLKNSFGITPTALYGSRETVFHYGNIQPPGGAPQEIDFNSDRYEGYRMPRLIVDIAGSRPVDLAIIDGIESCVGGEGPWVRGSKYCRPGVLLVGRNPVCTDAVATAVMGYNPRAGRHEAPFRIFKAKSEQIVVGPQYADNPMLLAEAVGIGSADPSRIELPGLTIQDALYDFEARWKGQAVI